MKVNKSLLLMLILILGMNIGAFAQGSDERIEFGDKLNAIFIEADIKSSCYTDGLDEEILIFNGEEFNSPQKVEHFLRSFSRGTILGFYENMGFKTVVFMSDTYVAEYSEIQMWRYLGDL